MDILSLSIFVHRFKRFNNQSNGRSEILTEEFVQRF